VSQGADSRRSGKLLAERMPKSLSAEDVLPLVACLPSKERRRLIRLIASQPGANDRDAYHALRPTQQEFSGDDDPLAWDSEGWEGVG
jgi:hypothetical protein